jgi:hypothetical protein
MDILLTIAIPTIEQREEFFYEFYNEIKKQSEPYGEQIEIIYLCDNKEISIGRKRQLLNEMAKGKYVVQWDDDDWIDKNAIDAIMEGIKSDCDVISYNIFSNVPEGNEIHSYNQYYSINFDYHINHQSKSIFFTPTQKMVIKTEIAKSIKFLNLRFREDSYYGRDIKNLLKTEFYIDKFLYHYINRTREKYFENIPERFGFNKEKRLI